MLRAGGDQTCPLVERVIKGVPAGGWYLALYVDVGGMSFRKEL